MKKLILRSLFRIMPAVALGFGAISCAETFDVKPEVTLDREQMYQNQYDADAAIVGIYGKFLGLADNLVVLNELRADLLNVTSNAASNTDLLEINYHSVIPESNNKYADPREFYEVIIACNDVIKNFRIMYEEEKLPEVDYNQKVSDLIALRSYIYLQLGIHFDEIPYITDPLENVNNLQPILNNDVNRLSLTSGTLLDTLINTLEGLPYLDSYPTESTMNISIDEVSTRKFFINKRLLLGDLHLWKGNYNQAATNYRYVMETGTRNYSEAAADYYYYHYRLGWSTNNHGFYPETAFRANQNRSWENEFIWEIPFASNFSPQNPFIDLFSVVGGEYLLKPSEVAMNIWLEETRSDNTPGDLRALGAVETRSGMPVVGKYLARYSVTSPYEKPGNWFLARASLVHLRFAEAANRDNKHKVAYALLNNGIQANYDPDPGADLNRDVREFHQTKEPAPYDFDARMGNIPRVRGPWHTNVGVRGRVNLPPLQFPYAQTPKDSLEVIEMAILEEAAAELAFEGHRWPDLLRYALRRTDEPGFLANAVYEKLEQANDSRALEVRTRLMNPANWFLPFRWE